MRKKWLMLAESVKCKLISLCCFHWYALHDGNFHKPCKVLVGFRLIFLFVCSMPKFSKIKVIGTTDARIACPFLFWLAIFQLTSAKFQTFAYNSRVVWSGYMKFWQQFEINELYVCIKFRGNRSRYPFIPTNPLLAAMSFFLLFFFFFSFFFLKFCTLFS